MMITKTYWKWDKKYNDAHLNLGDALTVDEINDFLILEKVDAKGFQFFELKSNHRVKLVLNPSNTIIKKAYFPNSTLGFLEIHSAFIHTIRKEVSHHLEPCDETTSGEKLILHYGDSILKAAILVA